jgi:hypothetical protein
MRKDLAHWTDIDSLAYRTFWIAHSLNEEAENERNKFWV